jgi:endonuclease YncB( thermonuclease family)
MGRRFFAAIVAVVLLFSSNISVMAQGAPEGAPDGAEAATVVAVLNGGTISVALGDGSQRNVGLIGVSAPTVPAGTEPGQCYGEESRTYLEGLAVPGSTVWLEQDPDIRERDETLLRYIWAVRAEGEKAFLINTKMVRDGRADVGQQGEKGKYAERLEDAENSARADRKGAWRACGQMHKENPPSEEQIKAQYQPLADVRDLFVRPGSLIDEKIVISGTVQNLQVAPEGYGYTIGDQISIFAQTRMQIEVSLPTGGSEWVVIGFNGDTPGIYEGTWVTVWGTVMGTASGTNAFGGTIVQPFVFAEFIQAG